MSLTFIQIPGGGSEPPPEVLPPFPTVVFITDASILYDIDQYYCFVGAAAVPAVLIPTGLEGARFHAMSGAGNGIVIEPAFAGSGETIIMNGVVDIVQLACTTPGMTITFIKIGSTWVVESFTGTWSVTIAS